MHHPKAVQLVGLTDLLADHHYRDLEIFNGPFKGFHGNVVDRLEDGAIRAQIIIFGKLNVVTLEASEYKEMKNE